MNIVLSLVSTFHLVILEYIWPKETYRLRDMTLHLSRDFSKGNYIRANFSSEFPYLGKKTLALLIWTLKVRSYHSWRLVNKSPEAKAMENKCIVCQGTNFSAVVDAWMKRTFSFVEKAGHLKMCAKCGAKYYECPKCGFLVTRVHPALEPWEVEKRCAKCGYENPDIVAWDGTSANPNKL